MHSKKSLQVDHYQSVNVYRYIKSDANFMSDNSWPLFIYLGIGILKIQIKMSAFTFTDKFSFPPDIDAL